MSSSDLAISVRGLGKAYTIAHQRDKHMTLGEAIMRRARDPLGRRQLETFWALRDVDLDIRQGEVVGVIGHNGAGKSTLLKVLSRITEPTEGRIDLWGRVGSLLEVGTGFHRELTGRENIYLNGAILGMTRKEIDRQFDAIVDFAGVERFLDTPVKRYSSGMYVRLAFAVAAHLEPEIMIVDEVLAVGDVEFQRKCMGKMQDVSRSGRTILFVSHNMRSVAALCNRVIVMDAGRAVVDDEAETAIQQFLAMDGRMKLDGGNLFVAPDPKKDAQVRRITISNGDGAVTQQFHVNDPITIEMELDVRRDYPTLVLVTQVRTLSDDVVFVTNEGDWSNHKNGTANRVWPKQKGTYVARVTLPAPLLNVGNYEIVVHLVDLSGVNPDTARGLRFEVSEINGFASCLLQRPRNGYLALPMPWEVKHV